MEDESRHEMLNLQLSIIMKQTTPELTTYDMTKYFYASAQSEALVMYHFMHCVGRKIF